MTKLHIFDMDGTLLRSTASVEISKMIGALPDAIAIEDGWREGVISDVGFWERCLEMWEPGLVNELSIDAAFHAAPWMEGIEEVFTDIAARGEHIAVITQSPQFFVDRLRRWGAHSTYGTQVAPGLAVYEENLISPEDKVKIVVDLLEAKGLTETSCVAYGDSTSDVPLFEWLPNTVAINASQHVKSLARASYEGNDLRSAYHAARGLFYESGATPPNSGTAVAVVGEGKP
jgi:phosphoserine phosphatase